MNFVTGATGFVGTHLVRNLLEAGEATRCLVRGAGVHRNLDGLQVETVRGDLREPDTLRDAMRGVKRVFHCAADYRLFVRDSSELYTTNVEGTRNVLEAAWDAGVEKVVYTSSVGALATSSDGKPAGEDTPVTLDKIVGHYKRSKFLAERVAEEWSVKGLPVVIVNPSTPIGEFDVKPTPTGKMIVDFLNGKMRAWVDTGLNLVDVRDVALGHILAARKGQIGQKYILGNRNVTLKELFDLLAQITGIPSPRMKVPHWLPLTFAGVDTFIARLSHREPSVSIESVRMSRYKMHFDSSKAVRELGIPQRPIEGALERAVRWFRDNGYARSP